MSIEEFQVLLKKANRGKACATEHDLQVQCINLARFLYPKLVIFAIPNGAFCGYKQGRKLVAEGLTAGVPDIFVALARKGKNGLFIEMKNGKAGRVSPDQKVMLERLKNEGYESAVCHDRDEFRQTLEKYIQQ